MRNMLIPFTIFSNFVMIGRYDVSAMPYWPGALLENFSPRVLPAVGGSFQKLSREYFDQHAIRWKNGKICHSSRPDKSVFVANLTHATDYWQDDSASVSNSWLK